MNISVQKLLEKIEGELRLAKQSLQDESIKEKIYSIKILCEIILDEKSNQEGVSQMVSAVPTTPQPSFSLNQPKKLDLGDEANGESLFDF